MDIMKYLHYKSMYEINLQAVLSAGFEPEVTELEEVPGAPRPFVPALTANILP